MDGRRIVRQAFDAQRVRDSHWMGPGLSVQQAMAAFNTVSIEGVSPGSEAGREIVKQTLSILMASEHADSEATPPDARRTGLDVLLRGGGQPAVGGNCACRGVQDFGSSCHCGAASVSCVYNPAANTCHCTGTCNRKTYGDDTYGVQECEEPYSFDEVADACDPAVGPRSNLGEPDTARPREVAWIGGGVVWGTPSARAADHSGGYGAGCVVNNSGFMLAAYDCDKREMGFVPPRSSNCTDDVADQQDWDYVLVGSTWYKMDGSALSLASRQRPVCTIANDLTVSGRNCCAATALCASC